MNQKLIAILIAVYLAANSGNVVEAQNSQPLSLEGKSFSGELKVAKGLFRWIQVEDSFFFENGMIVWESGLGGGYKPVPFETSSIDENLMFKARFFREEGDFVDWTGVYDGESISEVKGVWTIVEDDFVHNLLLPEKVNFLFIEDDS